MWLVDHRDILHLKRECVSVRSDRQAALQDRNNPIKPRRRNGWVKIVYLVSRGQRSLEQRESYMSARALLGRSRSPILSVHYAVVRCGAAERDPNLEYDPRAQI